MHLFNQSPSFFCIGNSFALIFISIFNEVDMKHPMAPQDANLCVIYMCIRNSIDNAQAPIG